MNVFGTQKNSGRQETVAEVEKSWKSYACFSADYLRKRKNTLQHQGFNG